jgi:hypothetical protein
MSKRIVIPVLSSTLDAYTTGPFLQALLETDVITAAELSLVEGKGEVVAVGAPEDMPLEEAVSRTHKALAAVGCSGELGQPYVAG